MVRGGGSGGRGGRGWLVVQWRGGGLSFARLRLIDMQPPVGAGMCFPVLYDTRSGVVH